MQFYRLGVVNDSGDEDIFEHMIDDALYVYYTEDMKKIYTFDNSYKMKEWDNEDDFDLTEVLVLIFKHYSKGLAKKVSSLTASPVKAEYVTGLLFSAFMDEYDEDTLMSEVTDDGGEIEVSANEFNVMEIGSVFAFLEEHTGESIEIDANGMNIDGEKVSFEDSLGHLNGGDYIVAQHIV